MELANFNSGTRYFPDILRVERAPPPPMQFKTKKETYIFCIVQKKCLYVHGSEVLFSISNSKTAENQMTGLLALKLRRRRTLEGGREGEKGRV